jgi:hypothetical protein
MLYSQKDLDANDVMQKVEELAFETIRDGEDGFRLIKTPQEHLVVSYGSEEEKSKLREAVTAIQAATESDDLVPRWAIRRLQSTSSASIRRHSPNSKRHIHWRSPIWFSTITSGQALTAELRGSGM